MGFAVYLIGYIIVIVGVSYAMHLMHIPQHWIMAVDLVLLGAAILTGVTSTRQKDPAK